MMKDGYTLCDIGVSHESWLTAYINNSKDTDCKVLHLDIMAHHSVVIMEKSADIKPKPNFLRPVSYSTD